MNEFKPFFDFKIKNNVIVELLKKENPRLSLSNMVGGISKKHSDEFEITEDPELYVKQEFKNRIADSCYNNTYLNLRIYFNLSAYNHVYQYFNMNEDVFNWELQDILKLSKAPQNMINTITDEIYPNIYAVMSYFPNIDQNTYTKGFKPDTIHQVRNYLISEDINALKVAYDTIEVEKLFVHLNELKIVRKIENSNFYIVNNQKSKKRSRVVESDDMSVLQCLKNIFPSFDALSKLTSDKNYFNNLEKQVIIEANKQPKNITNVFEFNENAKNIIYIVFNKTSNYKFKTYRFGTDELENTLKSLKCTTTVCIIFTSKTEQTKFEKIKHPFFNNITLITAIFVYSKLVSSDNTRIFTKLII